MIDTLVNAFRTPEIRRKLFFVAAMLFASIWWMLRVVG